MSALESPERQAYQTTYKESYRSCEAGLPPLQFHQQPAIELLNAVPQLAPRGFPLIPLGPHRRLVRARPPLGPGLGTAHLDTERYLDKKPIVKTPPPRLLANTVRLSQGRSPLPPPQRTRAQRLLKMREELRDTPPETIDSITKKLTWTSTTRRSTDESALPMKQVEVPHTTFEENADMVKQRPQKYEPRPCEWQRVSGRWDRAQVRAHTGTSSPETRRVRLHLTRLLPRRHLGGQPAAGDATIPALINQAQLNTPYVRQPPGYAGFIPRSPIEAPLTRRPEEPNITSVMRESYKAFPAMEYRMKSNLHKGPLSRTVTLTYPYNPFNKLEKRES